MKNDPAHGSELDKMILEGLFQPSSILSFSFILRVRKRGVRMETLKGKQKELLLETSVDTGSLGKSLLPSLCLVVSEQIPLGSYKI